MSARAGVCIQTGSWERLGLQAGHVRTQVFVLEQGVPAEIEHDALDAICVHALACTASGQAVGTGRLLPDGHIGRMAVLAGWRGRGIGSGLLLSLMQEARRLQLEELQLAAQVHARQFYARHGFLPQGDEFLEAGMAHIMMRCIL